MNEQLQGKLVEILAGIQSATRVAGDFAMEQLPDIAQSYVMYGRAMGIAWLLLAAVAAYGAVRFYRMSRDADDMSGGEVVGAIGTALSAIVSFALVAVTLNSTVLVWFAPKVWLLKELASLIK